MSFESFSQFCKFSFVSKIIFQCLLVDISFKPNHVKLLCLFFFFCIYLQLHLYFSRSPNHHNTDNYSTRASATIGIKVNSSYLGYTVLFMNTVEPMIHTWDIYYTVHIYSTVHMTLLMNTMEPTVRV